MAGWPNEIKHDAASIEAAILKAEPSEAVNVLVKLLMDAEIAADDEQRLREIAGRRAETATRKDGRIRLAAPPPDAGRLPVVYAIDEVLCSIEEVEPPMRDMDGDLVEVRVRVRVPLLLHELSSVGANQVKTKPTTRLPALEMPLLTKHDKISMAHLVERHTESETGGSDRTPPRSVASVAHRAA